MNKWNIYIKDTKFGTVSLSGEKSSNCCFKKSPKNGLTNKIADFVKKNYDKILKCYKYSFTVVIGDEKIIFKKAKGIRT